MNPALGFRHWLSILAEPIKAAPSRRSRSERFIPIPLIVANQIFPAIQIKTVRRVSSRAEILPAKLQRLPDGFPLAVAGRFLTTGQWHPSFDDIAGCRLLGMRFLLLPLLLAAFPSRASRSQRHADVGRHLESCRDKLLGVSCHGALLGDSYVFQDRLGSHGEDLPGYDSHTGELLLRGDSHGQRHGVGTEQHGACSGAFLSTVGAFGRCSISAKIKSMYRVEYQCPRKFGDWNWRTLKGFLGLFDQTFPDRLAATQAANGLMWQYHGARVVDPWGQVVYQV